jgi:hypothetical protein
MPFMVEWNIAQSLNFLEGILWVFIGVILACYAIRKTDFRRIQIGASVSFVLFGISDFIEIRTGAWYTPWTLLAFKAACVGHLSPAKSR